MKTRFGMITKVVSINRVSSMLAAAASSKFAALWLSWATAGHHQLRHWQVRQKCLRQFARGEAAAEEYACVAMKGTTISPTRSSVSTAQAQSCWKPAAAGTGMIAGGPCVPSSRLPASRTFVQQSMRSNNPINVVSATFAGLPTWSAQSLLPRSAQDRERNSGLSGNVNHGR